MSETSEDTGFEHGYSGYTNHSCRCVTCRQANADYKRAWKARQRRGSEDGS